MTYLGDLFEIALKLALLTFYLGALVYALPIPVRGLKRWGGVLIRDSLFSFALALSLGALTAFADGLARMMGGSWAFFDQWLTSGLELVLSLKVAVSAMSSLTSYIPAGSALKALLGPFNDALTADLLFLVTLLAMEFIVKTAGALVTLIGLVLFSLPFRLGREAGAWFIAFVLVFSVGLQVLPAFVSSIAESPQVKVSPSGANWGVTYVTARVQSAYGTPLGDAVLDLYVMKNGSPELVAQYVTDPQGEPIDPYAGQAGLVSLPSEVPVYAYVVDDGVESPLEPYPYSAANFSGSVTFTSPYILYSDGQNVIAFTNQPSLVNMSLTSSGAVARLNLSYGGIFEVRASSNCSVKVSSTQGLGTSSWSWDGINGDSWYLLGPTNATVQINVGRCQQVKVRGVNTTDYATDFFGLGGLSVNLLEDFIVYYFTVPLMYVAVLTTMTYALARLLGGRRGILPRLV